jgi:zinc transport system permease protein
MIEAFFQFDFIRYAVLSGIVIGFLAPLLGVFLVVRRLSMIADALSHITLSGIACSLFITKSFGHAIPWLSGLNPLFLGMGFSVAGALSIDKLRTTYKHYQELAIPIILSGGIGFGVVFISLADSFNVDLFSYLFGSIIAITRTDMLTIASIAIIVLSFILLLYKELFSLSFDEENAKTSGLPGRLINLFFMVLVALVIATSMRIVGILLVSALMVLPVAASMRIAKSFKQTFFYAILFGEISVLIGLLLSFEFNWLPGGTIVITSFLLLCIVIIVKKWFLHSD